MNKLLLAAVVTSAISAPAMAQDDTPVPTAQAVEATSAPAPIVAVKLTKSQTRTVLPANSEVNLTLNDTLTTKGKSLKEGDTFNLTVAQNVMLGEYVVIPKGSRALGEVTWLTSKGMFGKSGKMEIEVRYVEVNGQRLPLEGTFRQEGEGNTVATVAGVLVAPIVGVFITGKSGTIPAGRELLVRTKDDFPVELPEGATTEASAIQATRVNEEEVFEAAAEAAAEAADEAAAYTADAAADAAAEGAADAVEAVVDTAEEAVAEAATP